MIAIRRSSAARAGFSLLEVLVASAILGVVMMVVLSTLTASLALWRNTESKSLADREGRASKLLLAQDLANVVMPPEPALWPRLVTNTATNTGVSAVHLQLLTAVAADYQSGSGNPGDVCYVEYAILPSTNGPGHELRRLFWPSGQTYSNVLAGGSFPGAQPPGGFQSLGFHLLPDNRMAARGSGALAGEVNETNFVLLDANLRPFTGPPTPLNRPAVLEVTFAVADPETLRNTDRLNDTNNILRNVGLYSTRFHLPKPPNEP
jgi:prepilin-type N-terminal cleavage/methylation domain-containing protein